MKLEIHEGSRIWSAEEVLTRLGLGQDVTPDVVAARLTECGLRVSSVIVSGAVTGETITDEQLYELMRSTDNSNAGMAFKCGCRKALGGDVETRDRTASAWNARHATIVVHLEAAPTRAPDDELEFHAWPPSRGGQHVGVETGVLARHVRTGLAAISTECRVSRAANQAIAVAKLQAALEVIAAADATFALSMEPRLEEAVEEARCQGLTGERSHDHWG